MEEKMKNKLLERNLVVGIIFLFIIINIVPTDASVVNDNVTSTIFNQKEAKIIEKLTASQIGNKGATNLLCTIQVIWHPFKFKPKVNVIQGDKVFYFSEHGGAVNANFTIICETWSDPAINYPRISVFQPNLYIDINHPERTGYYGCRYQAGTETFAITWDNYVLQTNGYNISRIVWPRAGGILSLQYPYLNGWNITICPVL